MKTAPSLPTPRVGRSAAAFTLPELLFASTALLMVVAAIIGANLFGMRMYELSRTKLESTDAVRRVIGKMADEIRQCNSSCVGTVSNGAFSAHLVGELQTGNGLMIYPTTNTSNFITYYVNTSDQTFRRTTSTPMGTTILVQSITNTAVFQNQDFLGNVLTNNQNNGVIHLCLEFFQAQPYLPVPDYSKLETSVSPRNH